MDRLSGIYKRFSQYALLCLGITLAAGADIDSVRIARTLYLDPRMRSAILADTGKVADPATMKAKQALQAFENEHLPFGRFSKPSEKGDREHFLTKLSGWLLTGAAIALGAPFWFGLLQQLTNLRSAGPAPARAPAT